MALLVYWTNHLILAEMVAEQVKKLNYPLGISIGLTPIRHPMLCRASENACN